MRKQRVFLALNELAVLASEPGIFALAYFVQGLTQVTNAMELVKQNLRLRSLGRLQGRVLKGLPHVHHRQPNPLALLLSQPPVEQVHTFFRTILASKPDGSSTDQVTHHNPVAVPLFDGYLVNADDLRPRRSHLP